MADGHLGKCKSCCRAYAKQARRDDPEKFEARERARYVGERRRRIFGAAAVRRASRGPENTARTAVGNAVRDRRLQKPTACSCCGREGVRIEAHHDDYSKPLDVRWLCCRCHRRHHAEMNAPF